MSSETKNNVTVGHIIVFVIASVVMILYGIHSMNTTNNQTYQNYNNFSEWKSELIADFKGDVTDIRIENNGDRIVFVVSDAWYRLPDYQKDRISDIFANRYLYFCIDNNLDTHYNLYIKDSWGKTVKKEYYTQSN